MTPLHRRHRRALIAAVGLAVALTGCGGDQPAAETESQVVASPRFPEYPAQTTPSPEAGAGAGDAATSSSAGQSDSGDGGDDGTAMGGRDVTPADEVAGADVVRGELSLLDTAPEGSTVSGTALLARTDRTTVTLRLEGLEPGRAYVSHVHSGSCDEGGGPHYKHDPQGGDTPPNEIHLAFPAQSDGTIEWSVTNPMRASSEASAVVLHHDVEGAPGIACADLS